VQTAANPYSHQSFLDNVLERLRYALRVGLPYAEKAENGLGTVLTIVGMVLIQTGAVVTVLHERDKERVAYTDQSETHEIQVLDQVAVANAEKIAKTLSLYWFSFSVPLTFLALMARATAQDGTGLAFNETTRLAILVAAIFTVALVSLISAWALAGELPGMIQEINRNAAPYRFQHDKADGLVVEVEFRINRISRAEPRMVLKAALADKVAEDWQLAGVAAFRNGRELITEYAANWRGGSSLEFLVEAPSGATPLTAGKVTLKIRLRPKSGGARPAVELRESRREVQELLGSDREALILSVLDRKTPSA